MIKLAQPVRGLGDLLKTERCSLWAIALPLDLQNVQNHDSISIWAVHAV